MEKKQVSMRIDGELWGRVRVLALKRGVSASSLVEGALGVLLDGSAVKPDVRPQAVVPVKVQPKRTDADEDGRRYDYEDV